MSGEKPCNGAESPTPYTNLVISVDWSRIVTVRAGVLHTLIGAVSLQRVESEALCISC